MVRRASRGIYAVPAEDIDIYQAALDRKVTPFTQYERKWPPAWRVLFVVVTSAGLWTMIILALMFMLSFRALT